MMGIGVVGIAGALSYYFGVQQDQKVAVTDSNAMDQVIATVPSILN